MRLTSVTVFCEGQDKGIWITFYAEIWQHCVKIKIKLTLNHIQEHGSVFDAVSVAVVKPYEIKNENRDQ